MYEHEKGSGSRGRGGAAKGRGGYDSTVEWRNPSPSNGDNAWLETNADELVNNTAVLFDELSEHERVTIKFDELSSRWLAILFDHSRESEGRVLALSVRGATSFDALVLLHYFVHVKYADGWQDVDSAPSGKYG